MAGGTAIRNEVGLLSSRLLLKLGGVEERIERERELSTLRQRIVVEPVQGGRSRRSRGRNRSRRGDEHDLGVDRFGSGPERLLTRVREEVEQNDSSRDVVVVGRGTLTPAKPHESPPTQLTGGLRLVDVHDLG